MGREGGRNSVAAWGIGRVSQEGRWAWTRAVDTCVVLAGPVFSLCLLPLPWGLPVSWTGVSVPFPGWPSQVVGGGGGYGQLAESRPRACQAAYSNSGPQGPAGRQARAGGEEGAEPGPGLGLEEGWKQQNRPWTGMDQQAGGSVADLGNVSHLSWRAGTEHPAPGTHCPSRSHWQAAWHHCPVSLAWRGQCPLLGAGAARSPQSQGVSLSLGQALAGRLTACTGPVPTTTASWWPPLALPWSPSSQAPPAAGSRRSMPVPR